MLSVSGNVTLQGATLMIISAANGNDQLAAAGIIYGGTLVVTNFSGTITNGQTFQLFVATNGNYSMGTFASVTLPTAPGLIWTTNLAVNGTIAAVVVPAIPPTPTITHFSVSGLNLQFNGTNGTPGGTFYVVASTNVLLPLTNWTSISTNTFFGGGTFNVTLTNAVDPNAPQSFYSIKQTY